MPDRLVITCPEHGCPLVPSLADPVMLYCPQDAACDTSVRIFASDAPLFPSSPMTELEQGGAQQHEFVLSRVAAGFSRTEAMQILCCIVSAGIMKGSGDG
jgi:hypothetical protein